jgi:hypothetical protein
VVIGPVICCGVKTVYKNQSTILKNDSMSKLLINKNEVQGTEAEFFFHLKRLYSKRYITTLR